MVYIYIIGIYWYIYIIFILSKFFKEIFLRKNIIRLEGYLCIYGKFKCIWYVKIYMNSK